MFIYHLLKRYKFFQLLIAFFFVGIAHAGDQVTNDPMINKVNDLNGSVVAKYEGEHGLGKQILEVHLPELRMNDEQLARLGKVSSLESIELTGDLFTIGEVPEDVMVWLEKLPDLTKIKVNGFEVTDKGVESIAGLPSLKSVSLLRQCQI